MLTINLIFHKNQQSQVNPNTLANFKKKIMAYLSQIKKFSYIIDSAPNEHNIENLQFDESINSFSMLLTFPVTSNYIDDDLIKNFYTHLATWLFHNASLTTYYIEQCGIPDLNGFVSVNKQLENMISFNEITVCSVSYPNTKHATNFLESNKKFNIPICGNYFQFLEELLYQQKKLDKVLGSLISFKKSDLPEPNTNFFYKNTDDEQILKLEYYLREITYQKWNITYSGNQYVAILHLKEFFIGIPTLKINTNALTSYKEYNTDLAILWEPWPTILINEIKTTLLNDEIILKISDVEAFITKFIKTVSYTTIQEGLKFAFTNA